MKRQRRKTNGPRRTGWIALVLALIAFPSYAQKVALHWTTATEQSVHTNPDQNQVTLKQVLADVEKKHGIRITYQSDLVEKKSVSTQEVQRVLEAPKDQLERTVLQLVRPMGLQFRQYKKDYYILQKQADLPKLKRSPMQSSYRKPNPTLAASNAPKLSLRSSARLYEKSIQGKVLDETGMGLPGVNVLVKNTTVGTVTDVDGNYSLSAPDNAETLVFSSVGYLSQEISIGDQSTINVTMEPDVRSLEEVVVVGYGTQKKSDLTGAVSSVSSEDLNQMSERRLETALQGRAPGVTVTRGEGAPGSQSRVSIRGTGSLGDNGPLYVIDGVPQNPGNFFNPQDVESIEVLKDASAAAIYGARAAHGVVLITTKRGGAGKVKLNINSSTGFRRATQLPDALGTPDYIALASEARSNAGVGLEPSWDDPNALPNTDWFDVLFRTAMEQSHNISARGGNENANFFLSGAYDKEEGIYIDNEFERFSLRVNSDFKLGEIFKVGESFVLSRVNNNPTAQDNKDLEFALRAPPTYNPLDPSNPLGGYGFVPSYNNAVNPLGIQEQTHIYNLTRRINGNVYAELEPITGLRLRGSMGYNYGARLYRSFVERYDYGQQSQQNAVLNYLSEDEESYNLNLVLSYEKSLGEHNFSALAGVERFTRNGIIFDIIGTDFPVVFSESLALARGDELNASEFASIDDQYRLNSIFGRISYDYQGKYLFQGNIRRDGSSRFGPNEKYGVFPSASLGWRISQESFLDGVDWLSNLKLRASYGVLGSDRIGNYLFDANYTSARSTYPFDATGINQGTDLTGFYLARFSNENVKWEEVEQLDFGVDVGLLDDRLSLTADYYIKTTNDLLVNVPLPLSFGVSEESSGPDAIPVNVGSMENEGFELAAQYRQQLNDWSFNISANAAWVRNEIKNLSGDQEITRNNIGGNNPISGAVTRTVAGQPVGSFYGLIVDGIFQTQGEIDALNESAPSGVYQTNNTAPGDFRYRDISGPDGVPDGVITDADRTTIGNPIPNMTYAFNIKVGYKGLDFNAFFQGVQGVDVFNTPKAYYRNFYNDFNSTTQAFDRWTPSNPNNTHPRLHVNDPNGNFERPSTYFVEDGSFLKLRNIQLGYRLPTSIIERVGIENARIYLNAQNILTITNYDGLDPEVSNGDGNNTAQGVDTMGRYPQSYLISAGVQLGF